MSTLHITWYGHSNVLIQEQGISVLVDPFFLGNPFAPDWRSVPRPDIVAVTHDHGDHLGQAVEIAKSAGATLVCIADLTDFFVQKGVPVSCIANGGAGANIGGTVVERSVRLTMTQAFHSAGIGAPVGYVIEMPGGHTVYHAGDTGLFGDMQMIGDTYSIDVAMLPIGGVFTMDAKAASKAAAWLKARCVMPMHYATFPALAQSPDAFAGFLQQAAPQCRLLLPAPGETVSLD